MQPQISVIVPVYKTEKYLHQCIDSILAQTFTDFELILVNDGSPDNCGAICDEYAQKDKRIKVVHKKNGGVNAARADGVKCSTGEFITFVDSDDTLPQTALKDLFIEMLPNIDIVIGGLTTATGTAICYKEETINIDNYREETLANRFIHTGPVCKLFRKNLFNEGTFDFPREIYMGEDLIMNIRLAFSAKNDIKIISKSVYNYRDDNGENCCNNFYTSLEYETLFYHYYKQSIPATLFSKYIGATIIYRFKKISSAHRHYIKNNIWHIVPFHKELLDDIKSSKYKANFIKRVSIHCQNPISSYLFIKTTRLMLKMRNLIRGVKSQN